jgi:hypothetical protein
MIGSNPNLARTRVQTIGLKCDTNGFYSREDAILNITKQRSQHCQ